jgi:hypothetical protein
VHRSPDHQPGAHSPLCQLPGGFDADKSGSPDNQNFLYHWNCLYLKVLRALMPPSM